MNIDIIIPAYDAHETLPRCLASIVCQTIAKDLKVTIVDDCSHKPYDELIKPFQSLIDIQLLRMEKNGGPGVTRQYGYDHTSNE